MGAGLGVGLTNPTLATLASQHAGRRRQGAVLGVAQSSGGAGRTVGPVWNGMLYARLGPAAPFLGIPYAAPPEHLTGNVGIQFPELLLLFLVTDRDIGLATDIMRRG